MNWFKEISILGRRRFCKSTSWWIKTWQFNECSWYYNAKSRLTSIVLLWRHNGRDGVLNHQPQDCLSNPLFRRRSKKTSKLRVTGPCAGNSPVARKMFSFDDVIMEFGYLARNVPASAPERLLVTFIGRYLLIWIIHGCHSFKHPGPYITTAIWRCRNPFREWQRSFHVKLRSPWSLAKAPDHSSNVRLGCCFNIPKYVLFTSNLPLPT